MSVIERDPSRPTLTAASTAADGAISPGTPWGMPRASEPRTEPVSRADEEGAARGEEPPEVKPGPESRPPGAGPRPSPGVEADGPAATSFRFDVVSAPVAVEVSLTAAWLTASATTRPRWTSVPAVPAAAFVTALAEPAAVPAMLVVVALAALALAATALLTGWVTLSAVEAAACASDPGAALTAPGKDACAVDGAVSTAADVSPAACVTAVTVLATG